MSDILSLDTRKKIYDFIESNPGVNLTTIADNLNMKLQLVDYHILYLKQHELINISKEKGYKRFYPKGKVGIEDKKILSILRQETPLKIVIFLINNPFSRHKEILSHLHMSSPRFSYHLRKLIKNEIIEFCSNKKKTGYVVKNEKEIIRFIIKYKPTSVFEDINDAWLDFKPG